MLGHRDLPHIVHCSMWAFGLSSITWHAQGDGSNGTQHSWTRITRAGVLAVNSSQHHVHIQAAYSVVCCMPCAEPAACRGPGEGDTALPAAHGARAESGGAHAQQHPCAARQAPPQPQQLPGGLLLRTFLATRHSALPIELAAPNYPAGAASCTLNLTAVIDHWDSTKFPQLWLMLYTALPRLQQRDRGLNQTRCGPKLDPTSHAHVNIISMFMCSTLVHRCTIPVAA